MTNRCKQLIAAIFFVAITAAAAPQTGQTNPGQVAMEAAKKKEVIDGDLESAIKLYKEIVSKYARQRPLAAAALVRMADAYQKLGNLESRKIYEQVVRDYSDQKAEAAQARHALDGALASVYSAKITPTEVRFVFPLPERTDWEWYRRSTPANGMEYHWAVSVDSEREYGFGYFLFKHPDATPAHGSFDALLNAGQKSIFKANKTTGGAGIVYGPSVQVYVTGNQLVVSIKNPNSLPELLRGRPRFAKMTSQLPGEPEVVQEIPITYSEK